MERVTCFRFLGAGLAAISLIGPGVGIGIVAGSLIIGAARNFYRSDELFRYALFGIALTEAVALLGLMVALLILFK